MFKEILEEKTLPEIVKKTIIKIILEHSNKKGDKLYIDKETLKSFLKEEILEKIPEEVEIKTEIEKIKYESINKILEYINNIENNIYKIFLLEKKEEILKILEVIENETEEVKLRLLENLVNLQLATTKEIYTDKMTGLFNNNFYKKYININVDKTRRKDDFEILNNFIEILKEDNKDLMVYIDFANFKRINDELGHEYGDELIKSFGKFLNDTKELENDIKIRQGGDEFIIISSKNKKEKIKKLLESKELLYIIKKIVKDKIIVFPAYGYAEIDLNDLNKIENKKDVLKYLEKMVNSIEKAEKNMVKNKKIKKEQLGIKNTKDDRTF